MVFNYLQEKQGRNFIPPTQVDRHCVQGCVECPRLRCEKSKARLQFQIVCLLNLCASLGKR